MSSSRISSESNSTLHEGKGSNHTLKTTCIIHGLVVLSMSTLPPVIYGTTDNCKYDAPQCISHIQKALFYTGLSLLAVGISGHRVSLRQFFEKQTELQANENSERRIRKLIWGVVRRIESLLALIPKLIRKISREIGRGIAMILVVFLYDQIDLWSAKFAVPAICSSLATIIFIIGSWSYKPSESPRGSPITITFRVLVASASKIFHKVKDNELYGIEEANSLQLRTQGLRFQFFRPQFNIYYLHYKFIMSLISSHIRKLMKCRCLEKAAIVLPNATLEEQERNRWRLCKVSEVEMTKISVRWIPMWMTFLVCGVVTSIGDTYFFEQAYTMSNSVGHFKVPLQVFQLIYGVSTFFIASLAERITESKYNKKKKAQSGEILYQMDKTKKKSGKLNNPAIGIGVAMLFSVLCCLTAAIVEGRRLREIKSHGLFGDPDAEVPMSVFWLVPQFVLLAANDKISEISIEQFYKEEAPSPMTSYITYFTEAISGAGIVASVLTVEIVEKISKIGGKPSWFQETLNGSHLDRYYSVLAGLSAVNFLLFTVAAIYHRNRHFKSEKPPAPFDDNPPR
ncbi:Proton-dependent oligopeptide transporter family [Dillenia turbinata]|uniref:Proton-dependent oligopeptide transporter family n=1 Tax=Dillenia turbinata TaxID=194707 RepID=A0AAN8ZMD4_9MAGN